jgi:hypothetical protein
MVRGMVLGSEDKEAEAKSVISREEGVKIQSS